VVITASPAAACDQLKAASLPPGLLAGSGRLAAHAQQAVPGPAEPCVVPSAGIAVAAASSTPPRTANAVSPIALTRMTQDIAGQVFRVDGDRVQRLSGWAAAGEYRSKSGRAVEPEELVAGLPEVYGSARLDGSRTRCSTVSDLTSPKPGQTPAASSW
jgi:hypothetical protein